MTIHHQLVPAIPASITRYFSTRSSNALTCIALLSLLLSARADAAESGNGPIVLGYFPSNAELEIKDIPWKHFTHLCHAFLTSDSEGRIETNKFVPSSELTSAGKMHKVPVILSVGGWGDADGFEQATANAKRMTQWVDDVTTIVVDNGYSGLDVDWEFPQDDSTKTRFTALVRAVRAKFDQVEKEKDIQLLITAAVPARPQQAKWIDGPDLESSIDFLNVMAYDMSGPWAEVAAHHAPIAFSPNDPQRIWRSVSHAMQYWATTQKIPKRKLVMGIPLYGRSYPIRQPHESLKGLPAEDFGAPPYNEIVKMEEAGWMLNRDPDAQAPWLVSPQGEAEGLVAFDDPESARAKGKWARDNGYRGIFFWAIGQDYLPDGRQPVLEAAVEGWSQ